MSDKWKTILPQGHKILVEPVKPAEKTASGIILAPSVTDTEEYHISVGQVKALGPGCYKDRFSGTEWATGAWCKVGDFIIYPKFSPKNVQVGDDKFVFLNDDEVTAVVTDPQAVVAYLRKAPEWAA